jgi:lipid-A-disaccharide synthase
LIKTPYASIPNLLANKMLVPELIQDDASVDNLSAAVIDAFDADRRELLQVEFARLQELLAVDSGAVAAGAISELLAQ